MKPVFFTLIILSLTCTILYAPFKDQFNGTTYTRLAALSLKNSCIKELAAQAQSESDKMYTEWIALSFAHTFPTDLVKQTTTGSGTLSQSQGLLTVSSGTQVTATASCFSRPAVHSCPGKTVIAQFTAAFGATSSHGTATQYCGLLSPQDGYAIGYQNNSFGIIHRKGGQQVAFIAQTAFNIDTLDGKTNSGFILTQTNLNYYRISCVGLDTGPVIFSVMNNNGTWIAFHQIQATTLQTTPLIAAASLPLAIEITKSTSDATPLSIKTTSWSAKSEGANIPTRIWSSQVSDKRINGNTNQHVLTIRVKEQFKGSLNFGRLRMLRTVSSTSETNKIFQIECIKNATITGAIYTDINTNFSITEVTTTGTISGGISLFKLNGSSTLASSFNFPPDQMIIDLFPGETITLVASENIAGDININANCAWQEYY